MKRTQEKIAVVGAGAVGATLAQRIIESDIADVVLIDVVKNMACAKAYDLLDAAPIKDHERSIVGTDDYAAMKGCGIVVITAGLPRKPGMTREDLITKNAAIVRDVCEKVKEHAPQAILIIVTNPLDVMTYLARTTTGFGRSRVFGMAGVLDGSRFIQLVAAELKVPRAEVETFIMGSHGDTMVPVISKTTVKGESITDVMPKEKLAAIIKRTCDRGAEIVNLLGSGSAYYSPSAGVLKMIECIVDDSKEVLTVSACLEGEYGLKDIAIGVPCSIGRQGIEKVVEFELSDEEKDAFDRSARAVKSSIDVLSRPTETAASKP